MPIAANLKIIEELWALNQLQKRSKVPEMKPGQIIIPEIQQAAKSAGSNLGVEAVKKFLGEYNTPDYYGTVGKTMIELQNDEAVRQGVAVSSVFNDHMHISW